MFRAILVTVSALSMSAAELKIDHVTVAGRDLGNLKAALEVVGIPSENGGPHANHATEMALVSFPDGSYLELIALQPNADPNAVAAHTWRKFLEANAGPCAWAVQVRDVSAEAARLHRNGVTVSAPVKSGRTRPDGVRIDWETASVGTGPNGTFFPFLIRDITPRAVRAYPSGKPTATKFRGIAKVVIAVKNIDESIEQYRRAYDLPAPKHQRDAGFGADLASFEGTPVVFASPVAANSWLSARIAKFGDGPCAFVLRGAPVAGGAPSTWFGKSVSWFDSAKLGWHLGVE
jgi:hypothetical protein